MFIAAKEAVDKAVKVIIPGTKTKDVTRIIQRTIESYGYKPIANLTGHRIMPYIVHSSPSIPNVASQFTLGKFDSDNVYAIEPFVTTVDAAGIAVEGSNGNIYHIAKMKRLKDKKARDFLHSIYDSYKTLPFTMRWLLKETSPWEMRSKFNFLLRGGYVKDYPILYEQTGRPVVQMEHSILLTDKETITLT